MASLKTLRTLKLAMQESRAEFMMTPTTLNPVTFPLRYLSALQ